MAGTMERLRRKRLGIFALNLVYFLALLGLGVMCFLWGAGAQVYWIVALCLVLYLVLVRPATKRYVRRVREEILRDTLSALLEDYRYEEKPGVTAQQVQESGLVPTTSPKSFFSREHITGRQGEIQVEAADVTFPIRENNLNAMFSGCYLRLRWPGAELPSLTVRRSRREGLSLPAAQKELLDQLCAFIPGNLYLDVHGEQAQLLLRGRFLGFRINPLMPLGEEMGSPLPELELLLRLVRLMNARRASHT